MSDWVTAVLQRCRGYRLCPDTLSGAVWRKLYKLIIAVALVALGAAASADWLGFVALDMADSTRPSVSYIMRVYLFRPKKHELAVQC